MKTKPNTPHVIQLDMPLIMDTVPQVLKTMQPLFKQYPILELDLLHLPYIDSAGIACLLTLYAEAKANSCTLIFTNLTASINTFNQLYQIQLPQ